MAPPVRPILIPANAPAAARTTTAANARAIRGVDLIPNPIPGRTNKRNAACSMHGAGATVRVSQVPVVRSDSVSRRLALHFADFARTRPHALSRRAGIKAQLLSQPVSATTVSPSGTAQADAAYTLMAALITTPAAQNLIQPPAAQTGRPGPVTLTIGPGFTGEVAAEVGVARIGVGEQVPDDNQRGPADSDDRSLAAAAPGDASRSLVL